MTTHRQYAVIDFETTGFGAADRIIEIGVVLLNRNRELIQRWETLVQPERDISNSFVHRIAPSDVVGAPTFGGVAGELASILNGRTLVAHNASFEVRFLQQEFERIGVKWPHQGAWIIDTQRLFRQQYPNEPTALVHALEQIGIVNSRPHSALADAEATAQLFTALSESGSNLVMSAAPLSLAPFDYPASKPLKPRSAVDSRFTVGKGHWLSRLTESLPNNQSGHSGSYRKALTAALVDKELSRSEIEQLSQQALIEGLAIEDLLSIHEEFIRQLAIEAWLDGQITEEERETIVKLNEQLGLAPELAFELLETPQKGVSELGLELSTGDRVTFTGQLALPREEWERRAIAMGLSVGGVTKKSAALIAASPDSMSGKARRAREYNIPIIGEKTFAQILHSMGEQAGSVKPVLSSSEPTIEPTDLQQIFAWSSFVTNKDAMPSTTRLAQEWCADHPTRPLVEISPSLKTTTPIEVQNSFRRGYAQWFTRFPEPLAATVQDLQDLAGVGQHKLTAMVEAVVLAAIDSHNDQVPAHIEELSNVYSDEPISADVEEFVGLTEPSRVSAHEMTLYVGWWQLVNLGTPLPPIPASVRSEMSEIMEHLRTAEPLGELFDRAVEDIVAAAEGDERKIEIVKRRWIGDATLDEIGTEFGVTRERVRQLESQWRKQFESDGGLFQAVIEVLRQRLAPIASLETVRNILPALFAQTKGFDCTYGELFTAIGKSWDVQEGWVVIPGFNDLLKKDLAELSDHQGVVSLSTLADSLGVSPSLVEEFIVTNESLKVLVLDDKILTRIGNHQDRAVGVLAINGEPMTAEEIMDVLGGGNYRSATNQFSVDPRLVKVSADQWALKEWGRDEFKSIASWIRERLSESNQTYTLHGDDADGVEVQAISLEELLSEADRLRISVTSIRHYASLGDFETRDGMVFNRVDESANLVEGDIEETRDVYWRDGEWHLLLTVNKDHLRGSGFQVPLGVAAFYGVKVGENVTLSSRLGEQYVRVNRLKQASLSTIKRFLDHLGAAEGQRVWLKLGADKTFDVVQAPDVIPNQSGVQELYNFVGLDPQVIGPDEDTEESLARVNVLLGLSDTAPRRRTVATFRHRRQDGIADLIQEL